MRMPYAMRTITEEIGRVVEDAVLETQDPDGFGVWRTLVLDTETTKVFRDVLDMVDDQRIADRRVAPNGRYYLYFVPDRRADDAKPFSLDRAMKILAEPEPAWPTREQRKAALSKMKVAELRAQYGLPSTTRKTEAIDLVLADEGY